MTKSIHSRRKYPFLSNLNLTKSLFNSDAISADGKLSLNFDFKKLGWKMELGGDVNQAEDKFWLSVDGVRHDQLPKAPADTQALPELCSSDCFAT